ncbi:MAG: c-type cytochrome [Planctomycetes bacterium]|nr:c-type cytochrome [Planctomycetota bacterium]
MADKQPEYFYPMGKLHKLFFLSSGLMLLAFLWMLWQDYDREWKYFQRDFNQFDVARIEKDKRAAQDAIDKQKLAALKAALAEGEKEIVKHEKEVREIAAKQAALLGKIQDHTQQAQFAKAQVDSALFEYEESRHHAEKKELDAADVAARKATLDKHRQHMAEENGILEPLTASQNALAADLKQITARRDVAQKGLEDLHAQVTALEGRHARVETNFQNTFRNLPFFDFIDPTIKVRQYVLPEYWDDYNFARVYKVERCTTCHLGIDKKGWEGADVPKVFRSHPRLELYLGGTSPHPIEKFGCTTCHDGQGRALTFNDAGHTPADEAQTKEWEEKYHWHPQHHWDFPMKPKAHLESTCYKCHTQEEEIRGADHWNRGRRLFERAGCFGCHQTDGFQHMRKIGPDLYHLADKVTRDWAYQWILDPPALRPTTRMPKVFNLSNTDGQDDKNDPQRNAVAADCITDYLFSLSDPMPVLRVPPGPGDPEKGRAAFDRVGCKACHLLGDKHDTGDEYNNFGPNLTGIGSKTTHKWIFNWLKDPKAYFAGTAMPNLRLSDAEATDIAAWLMASTDPDAPNQAKLPEQNPLLDELAITYLWARLGPSDAERELAGYDTQKKRLFVGERMINRQGCFGCHQIKGMEKITPIGVTFTGGGAIGSKDIDRIDFAFVDIPKTRHDWLKRKVRDPRVYDHLRDRTYDDKLRMPRITWLVDAKDKEGKPAPELVEDLATFVLGFVKTEVPSTYRRVPDEHAAALEAGKRLIKLNNCRSCHFVDNDQRGGVTIQTAVGEYLAVEKFGQPLAELATPERTQIMKRASVFSPPPLNFAGERIQPLWLFDFLRAPTTVRVHVSVRMPTFGFTEEEATTLTKYLTLTSKQKFPFDPGVPMAYHASWKDKDGKVQELSGAEYLKEAKALFLMFECAKCHQEPKPKQDLADLAPSFLLSGKRLKPDWVLNWIKNPAAYIKGTKMPQFWPDNTVEDKLGGDADLQMKAVRDYVMQIDSPDDLK